MGVEFRGDHEALELFAAPGARVDGERVRFEPGHARALCATAPPEFRLHSQDPAKTVTLGGDNVVLMPGYGSPFVSDLSKGRRYATLEDFRNVVKLTYSSPALHHSRGTVVEPTDVPVNKRHLDMVSAHLTMSTKPFMGSVTAPDRAQDSIEMARLVFGHDVMERDAVMQANINVNSPLVFDDTMSSALHIYANAGQCVCVSPAIFTGAKAAYLCALIDQGRIADDAIVSNNGDNEWMIVHCSGDTMALLEASAAGRDVQINFIDDLHDLSVHGPASLEILNAHTDIDLAELAYFDHTPATLFDHPCRISRTGYSGERGYEIFADGTVITDIWGKLVQVGVMPCSFAALDKVRIEAGLLFYGYDMTAENTPWEVGLGFTVSTTKADYRGKAAVVAAKGAEKVNNVCLDIDHPDMVPGGETLSLDGEPVGVINSPCYSHRMGKSLALAHVVPGLAVGTKLTMSGGGLNTQATIAALPIYNPTKLRTHE
nr:trimethylamine methyltransferase family protein [uncultured Ruegeria sp.]